MLLFGMCFNSAFSTASLEIDGAIYTFDDGDRIESGNIVYLYDSADNNFCFNLNGVNQCDSSLKVADIFDDSQVSYNIYIDDKKSVIPSNVDVSIPESQQSSSKVEIDSNSLEKFTLDDGVTIYCNTNKETCYNLEGNSVFEDGLIKFGEESVILKNLPSSQTITEEITLEITKEISLESPIDVPPTTSKTLQEQIEEEAEKVKSTESFMVEGQTYYKATNGDILVDNSKDGVPNFEIWKYANPDENRDSSFDVSVYEANVEQLNEATKRVIRENPGNFNLNQKLASGVTDLSDLEKGLLQEQSFDFKLQLLENEETQTLGLDLISNGDSQEFTDEQVKKINELSSTLDSSILNDLDNFILGIEESIYVVDDVTGEFIENPMNGFSSLNQDTLSTICETFPDKCMDRLPVDQLKVVITTIPEDVLIQCIGDEDCVHSEELVKEFNEQKCSESIFSCIFSNYINEEKEFKKNLQSEITLIETSYKEFSTIPEITIGKTKNVCEGTNPSQCQSKVVDLCNKQKEPQNCISLASLEIEKNSRFSNDLEILENNNNDLREKIVNNVCKDKGNVCITEMNNCLISSDGCDDTIQKICKDATNKNTCIDRLELGEDQVERSSLIKTTKTFDIINAVLNPDREGLDAAALFGFESKYDQKWQIYDSASYVCLAKYGGYLDTQEENQVEDSVGNTGATGITQYGCTTDLELGYSVESGERIPIGSNPCREIIADLRAERTPILPSREVQLTYSGYLKAPPSTNISYMLYAIYQEENNSNPTLKPLFLARNGSLQPKILPAGEDDTFYNSFRTPSNATLATPIGEEGITLLLQAYVTEGRSKPQEYVTIITPAYEITASSYNNPLGQQRNSDNEVEIGSEGITSTSDTTIDDQEILDAACQLIDTC